MNKHRFNILPAMSTDEYNQLVEDIKTHGYDSRYPIVCYENKILDGWHRFTACMETDVFYTKVDFHGTSQQALDFVIRSNRRRSLTPNQLTLVIGQLYELHKKEIGAPVGNDNAKNKVDILSTELTYEMDTPKTDAIIGKQFGVHPRTVRRAAHTLKVFEQAPEPVKERFTQGAITQKGLEDAVKPSEPDFTYSNDVAIADVKPVKKPFDKREMKRLISKIAFEIESIAAKCPDSREECDKALVFCREAQEYTGV